MKIFPTFTRFFYGLILTTIVGYLRAGTLTLDAAISEAYQNNPSIQAARYQIDATSAAVVPSYVWPDPRFEVMWMNIPEASLDPRDAGMRQYSVTQVIPFPGKQVIKGSVMSAKADIVEAQSDAHVNTTLADVERSYWNVYRVERDKAILEESVSLLDQLLASVRSRYTTGAAPQSEVLRTQLARSEVDVTLLTLEEKLAASRIELALLLGRDADDLPILPRDIPIEFASAEVTTESAPMIQASQANLRAADRQLARSWLDAAPDFMAAYRWRDGDALTGTSDIMLGITLPIYVWPRSSNRIIRASADRKAAIYQDQAIRNRIEIMYTMLGARLTSSQAEIERTQLEVLPLAEQALASTRIAYETGAVEFNTLLEVERSWRSARMSLEASHFTYRTALADMKALVGGYEIDEE